jgi:hypothetical protein
MLSWGTILYGAALSAIAAIVLVAAALRERRVPVLVASGASAALGAFLWNAILHRVGGREFFVDAPVALMPASWQDTGSGVFAVALTSVTLGLGPHRRALAQTVALAAVLCGLAAFLVDVYLY